MSDFVPVKVDHLPVSVRPEPKRQSHLVCLGGVNRPEAAETGDEALRLKGFCIS